MVVEDIKEIIKAFKESGIEMMEYEQGDIKLKLKNETKKAPQDLASALPEVIKSKTGAVDAGSEADGAGISVSDSADYVKSPLVGTFYEAPSPDDDPFVRVGDAVKKGQVIGIVEAMKLMNEIEAEKDGIVKSVLVKNGDVVEYDQPLFEIG